MTPPSKICWTITDEFPGMKSQVIGLAEAIGLPTVHKTCHRRWPWGWLSLPFGNSLGQLTSTSDPLSPPWPDLVISCGRRSAPLSLAIKRKSKGKTFCVHIQDPLFNYAAFDLIIVPEHDKLVQSNVVTTKGAIHKVNPQKIEEGVRQYKALFHNYPRPFSTVLLGGNTNRYHMSEAAIDALINQIRSIPVITKGSVLVTPSFRTPYREKLAAAFESNPHIYLADIETLNPYFAMLGLAETLFVTDDSVNMVCEACSTGKPVYILPLLGQKNTKPKKLIKELEDQGIVRFFEGKIEAWTYSPFNDTAKVARIVKEKMAL